MKDQIVRVVFLEAMAAVHADSTTVNGVWNFKTSAAGMEPICTYLDLMTGSVRSRVSVAEVLQVQVLTVATATAGALYSLNITQYNRATKQNIFRTYYWTATATDTTTTIAQALRAQVNADAGIFIAATGGAAAITLTAETPYAIFFAFVKDGASLMSLAAPSTAGVYSVGTAADLNRMGYTGLFTGTVYTWWEFEYKKYANEANAAALEQRYKLWIFLNQGGANYAALQAYMLEQFAGLVAGGAAIDGEIVAML